MIKLSENQDPGKYRKLDTADRSVVSRSDTDLDRSVNRARIRSKRLYGRFVEIDRLDVSI